MKSFTSAHPAALLIAPLALLHAADDIIIADFDGPDYGAWTVSGKPFGSAPAQGAKPGQQPVSGFEGHGLVNSFGDDSECELLSPEFTIARGSSLTDAMDYLKRRWQKVCSAKCKPSAVP